MFNIFFSREDVLLLKSAAPPDKNMVDILRAHSTPRKPQNLSNCDSPSYFRSLIKQSMDMYIWFLALSWDNAASWIVDKEIHKSKVMIIFQIAVSVSRGTH